MTLFTGEGRDDVTCRCLQVKEVKRDDVSQMNPPKFHMYDDMAELTYLNEATILHNLRARYSKLLIYVSTHHRCDVMNVFATGCACLKRNELE